MAQRGREREMTCITGTNEKSIGEEPRERRKKEQKRH